MIYLASPYSDPDPEVLEMRFDVICRIAAKAMQKGQHVFSPIAHCHPIAKVGKLPTDFQFWNGYDRWFITHCQELHVVQLPGWERSIGVRSEILIAEELGVPVRYVPVP